MDRRRVIAAVAYHLIKSNRRAGWEARMRSNLDRWEGSITRLKSAQDKIKRNIRKNQESLEKAENFFNNLNSEKSKTWYSNTLIAVNNGLSKGKEDLLRKKLKEHDEKVLSVKKRIGTLKSWIADGNNSVSDIHKKIRDLEDKVSDVESKL